jgi:hypothetical protein
MTKIEHLSQTAAALSEDQLDGLIEYAKYLVSEPFYASAPPEALASIERGLAQHAAGQHIPADQVLARLQRKIDAAS